MTENRLPPVADPLRTDSVFGNRSVRAALLRWTPARAAAVRAVDPATNSLTGPPRRRGVSRQHLIPIRAP